MPLTQQQIDAQNKLLATGNYETYTDATGSQAVRAKQPTTPSAPAASAPSAGATSNIAGLTGLRDYGSGKGYNIGWDAKTGVTVNGNKVDTSGLTLNNGRYYGSASQLDSLFAPFAAKTTEAPSKGTYSDKIAAALEGITNYKNTPYDVTTDPQYNAMRNQYDLAGQTAFNNQIGRLAALTGGRASTAAVGTAAAAQNQYANQFTSEVLPSLISAEETRRQNELSNMYNSLEALQGLDSTEYSRTQDTKNEYANTISRFGENYQAEINKVQNDGDASNDWQIAYLQTARQGKLQDMAEAKATAATAESESSQAVYESALAAWKVSGVATSDIASILGVPVGSKTADFNIDSINSSIAQQNANTSSYNASTSRINANKSSSSDLSAAELDRQDFAADYSTLKSYTVAEAKKMMTNNWSSLLARYGAEGVKNLWNTVLAEAIDLGQAEKK